MTKKHNQKYYLPRHSTKLGAGFAIIFGWLLLSSQPTQAQITNNPIDIAISPPTAYVHVKPGETLTHEVTLENKGSQDLELNMTMTRFSPDGLTGKPVLNLKDSLADAFGDNVKIDQKFTLKKGERRTIDFKIDIAASAQEKEHPLTLLFTAKPINTQPTSGGSSAQVSGIIGSNLIIFISPTDNDQGEIVIDQIDAPIFVDSFSKIPLTIIAKNIGLNATPTKGEAAIASWFNKQVAEYVFYPDMVLANSSRRVRGVSSEEAEEFDIDETADEQLQQLSYQFDYDSPFLLGAYTISVTIGRDMQQVRVIALPFSLMIAAVIAGGIYIVVKIVNQRLEIN